MTQHELSLWAEPEKLTAAANYIESQVSRIPDIVIVLGSGMAYFAEKVKPDLIIATDSIPHYPSPTVAGHKGRLIFGEIAGTPILAVQGRTHFYEGVSLKTVTFPVQLFHRLGIRNLILTNAAGGVNPHYTPGDFILIDEIMNFTQISLLDEPLPVRPFSLQLQAAARAAADDMNYSLKTGTYCWTTGPSFETNAEVQAVRKIGGDLVGMSTVPEVAAANKLGMDILGISLVTNLAAGIGSTALTHEEVQEVAEKIREPYSNFMSKIIKKIG